MKFFTVMIDENEVNRIASSIAKAFRSGNKLMVAGNGGSAADAQHFVAELVCTYKDHNRKGFPAICLNSNVSVLTAWSNDYGYDGVFARQIEALGTKGDIFIGLSTSGKSKNIVKAMEMAGKQGLLRILITGNNKEEPCDWVIHLHSKDTPRVQENTIYFLHELANRIEKVMF
jgi:D-sedoheptulose 7-phosphate isomerase